MKSLNLLSIFFLWSLVHCSNGKRASLHELLKRNREMASVAEPSAPQEPVENQNRRVLVIGDADEQPNYVYDDEQSELDATNPLVPEADIYEPSKGVIRNQDHTSFGEDIKDYSDPYNVASAPSYSDPELLAAVMNQADEANFRYPIRKPVKKDSSRPTAPVIDRPNLASSRPNNPNPHSLFPPDFHEFLDIPMHTFPKEPKPIPAPKRQEERLPQNPIVIGGYANTNINGKLIQTQEAPTQPESSKPQKSRRPITTLRHPAQKFELNAASKLKEPEQDNNRQIPSKPRESYQEVGNKRVAQLKPTRLPPPVTKHKEESVARPYQNPFRQSTSKNPADITEIRRIKDQSVSKLSDKSSTPLRKIESHTKESKTKQTDRIQPYGTKLAEAQPTKQKDNKSSFKPSKPDPFFPPYQPLQTVYSVNKPHQALPEEKYVQEYHPPISSLPPVVNAHSRPPVHSSPVTPQRVTYFGNNNNQSPISQSPYNTNNINYQQNGFNANPPLPFRLNQSEKNPFPKSREPSLPPLPLPQYEAAGPQRPHYELLPPTNRHDTLHPPNLPIRPRRRPQRKNGRPNLRKRPSFLESFGFFNPWSLKRRTGKTGEQEDDTNNAVVKDNNGRYILSHGPLPPNAKKVVVMGPFKKPPIGAPVINPKKVFSLRKKLTAPPPSGLFPPSLHSIPTEKLKKSEFPAKKVLPKKKREPSFKVIHISEDKENKELPAEQNETEIEAKDSLNILEQEKNLGSVESSPKFKRKVDSVVYGKPFPPIYKPRSSSIKEVTSSYNVGTPTNQLPVHLQEVSDYDKQRIIAAKFYFPRSPSIKRLGMERHIIPIPVPILTPRGRQVLGFQDLVLPKAATNRRMPVLPPPPRHHNQLSRKIHHSEASNKSKHPPRMAAANRFNPNVLRRGFSGVFPQPESFIEPTVSKVNYGGWKAVESENTTKKSSIETIPEEKIDAEPKVAEASPLIDAKEKNLVRYSSKLKIELDDKEKGYFVESSN